jgi:hypothetical protein
MADSPDYHVDIDGIEADHHADGMTTSSPVRGRKWIGMHFECCGVYQRIYRNREGTYYRGNCPRCGTPIQIRVGPGGTDDRMFRAT